MSIVKKTISILMCIALVFGSAYMIASADSSNAFRQNAHWKEITKSEADSMYSSGKKFIVTFCHYNCADCRYIGESVITPWMDIYGADIYGVDADANGVSTWATEALGSTNIALPAICFVENKTAVVISATDKAGINAVKSKFFDFTDISPESTYTLVYDDNGGQGGPESIVGKGNINLSKTVPSRNGFEFLGWSTNAAAVTAQYSKGASFSLNENTVLYATWKKTGDIDSYTCSLVYHQSEARSILDMINSLRTGANAWYWNADNTTKTTLGNLAPLKYDYELEQIAMQRAAELVVRFSHDRPNDGDPTQMFTWDSAGENIAYGQSTAAQVEETWEEADNNYDGQGHRRNILSSRHTAVGIACVEYEGRKYWVEEFRNPVSSAPYTLPADSARNVDIEILDKYISGTSVTLSEDLLSVTVGTGAALPTLTENISISVNPKNTLKTAKAVEWRSDDNTIAKISGSEVIGVKEGETTLSGNYGGKEEVKVKVIVGPATGPVQYTLYFDANGGEGGPNHQLGNGEITINSARPGRDKYTFLGWSLSPSATSPQFTLGETFTLTENTVLYAVWRKNPEGKAFTLTFNKNGGTGGPVDVVDSYGYITLDLSKPVKSGYVFVGWAAVKGSVEVAYEPGDKYNLSENATLYAIWKEGKEENNDGNDNQGNNGDSDKTYTLTYNANGGTGAPAAQTGNGSITLSSATPAKGGYVFLGWATTASAKEAKYKAGTSYKLTSDTTLYAVWTNEIEKGHGVINLTETDYEVTEGEKLEIKYTVTSNEDFVVFVESADVAIVQVAEGEKGSSTSGKCTIKGMKEGKITLTFSLRDAKTGAVYDIKTADITVKAEPLGILGRIFRFIRRVFTAIFSPIANLFKTRISIKVD